MCFFNPNPNKEKETTPSPTPTLPIPKVPFWEIEVNEENEEKEKITWIELYQHLFLGRFIFLGKPIDAQSTTHIVKSMIHLDQQDAEMNFKFFMHCRGGSLIGGISVYDVMQYVTGDVTTVGVGLNASAGAFMLHGGTVGKRFIGKHGRAMIHQPFVAIFEKRRVRLTVEDAQYMNHLRNYVAEIYARNLRLSPDRMYGKIERDVHLTSKQALHVGLVDRVLDKDKLKDIIADTRKNPS
uniref:ATP-dependent Clp protease proteolytic subunit n=7 Tax=Cephalotaxus TaxID=50178 RepID=A0A140GA95_9CONI|nr:ATP-dependent Clp protease proteolytic subunit [Cephalotaxus harringtonia var. wilsoniana]YP_009471730.1 ATP-dependent Clp protease proteolytic subunit [Cephalotaxus sinensis]YP_009641660.1 ATP-dependent Clp protease proteolytic subunit [Cephalotaxus hainanensis]YP_010138068.1 ATP-dependent Clp protease proteolytic subunit [Cephalotaxus griffithii]YP_010138150.1 ATP-dependent Clp protease proteolytic subunit [Cephalotaxus harringtonia]YP_010138314.1 ATP-dependent Clp protease proteolytic su